MPTDVRVPSASSVFSDGRAGVGVTQLDQVSPQSLVAGHRSAAGVSDALIMMVDDEPLNIEMTRSFLMDAGYQHFTATHEPELAMGMMRESGARLVLLDLSMPRVDGLSILKSMRDDPALRHVPVIVMTSSLDPQVRLEALAAGAMDFLPKPVDPDELALRVRNTLAAALYRDYLAHHDALTGLPNRLKYLEQAAEVLAMARRSGHPGALIHVGVEQVDLINDALGRAAAETVLRRVASALAQCTVAEAGLLVRGPAMPPSPSLYRFDDDEFAVIVPAVTAQALAGFTTRLLRAGDLSFQQHAGAPTVAVSCRIGVAKFPDDGDDAGVLVHNAGTAMRHARQPGSQACEFFAPRLNDLARARLSGSIGRPDGSSPGPDALRQAGAVDAPGAAPGDVPVPDAVFDALPEPLALLDAAGCITRTNRAWQAFQSQLPGAGSGYDEVCASFAQTPFLTRRMSVGVQRVLDGEASLFREEYAHAGNANWFELVVAPLREDHGAGALLMLGNVTARKQAEQAQRRDRQLLDNIVENIPTAVQIKAVADDLRIVMWNKAAEAIYGVDRARAIGSTVHDLWPADTAARMMAEDLDLLQRGGQQEFPERLANNWRNSETHLHMRKVPLYDDAGIATHLLVIADDVTAQRKREAALRESEERFRGLTAMSTDWYWQQDAQFRFVFFSGEDATSDVPFRSAILGKPPWELPHRQPMIGTWADHRRMLDEHLPFKDFEYVYFPPDTPPAYLSVNGEPLYDAAGAFTGYRGTARDITAAKAAELEIMRLNTRLEERVKQRTSQLQAANKELQSFAYSVAHDLRGPLTSINGFTHIIERSRGEEATRSHALGRIRAIVKHMDELTWGLLALAQLSRVGLRMAPVDLGELAQRVHANLAERDATRAVQFHAPSGLVVECDAVLMTQLLENLIGNAWKFTARQPLAQITMGAEADAQGGTRYFVRDNGAGFDAAQATKLFGAFERYHKVEEFPGSGVGLATVHRIVTRHGGRVWAESSPGEGATFFFTLGDVPVEAP